MRRVKDNNFISTNVLTLTNREVGGKHRRGMVLISSTNSTVTIFDDLKWSHHEMVRNIIESSSISEFIVRSNILEVIISFFYRVSQCNLSPHFFCVFGVCCPLPLSSRYWRDAESIYNSIILAFPSLFLSVSQCEPKWVSFNGIQLGLANLTLLST